MPSTTHFNPRSSCEERPDTCLSSIKVVKFQSTLRPSPHPSQSRTISIHAPHARSDVVSEIIFIARPQFQSTLLMRGATTVTLTYIDDKTFQSTLLMRGATSAFLSHDLRPFHFNPRSSCEERQCGWLRSSHLTNFNPRSSCEERLVQFDCIQWRRVVFQSTLLMRGATIAGSSGARAVI